MSKPHTHLILSLETCYCIRSTFNGSHVYFMSPEHWADHPRFATVFRSYEAGQSALQWARMGRTVAAGQVFDVVTVSGALVRPYA